MGGIGSGRYWRFDTKHCVTDYQVLDVRRWAREGCLQPGDRFGWQWTEDGEQTGSIQVAVELGRIRLIYRSQSPGSDWENMDYAVRLLSTPCQYGGERQWFACPAVGCGRRVAKLYGGRVFACRHCHQLAYPSQREPSYDRIVRRADNIRARLGWEPGLYGIPGGRPKGMHRRTYERLVSEVDRLSDEAEAAFADRMAEHLFKLDARFGR